MTGQRIAPGTRSDVGTATWALAHAAGWTAGTGPMRLFLTLGRHRRLFRGWLRFAARLMPRGLLPRRETELVILRVATLAGCDYELHHHRRLGRRAGLTEHEIRAVTGDAGDGAWTAREQAILDAVEELHHRRDLGDASWARLRGHLDDREAIELLLLAGHYEMLATTITTLRLRPEQPRRWRDRVGRRQGGAT